MHKVKKTRALKGVFLLLILGSMAICHTTRAQGKIKVTNLLNDESFTIKRNSIIQCRYRAYREYELVAVGIVRQITDTSLVYSATILAPRKEILLSSIVNIDKVPVKRVALPAFVSGLIVGSADVLVNPRGTPSVTGIFGTIGTILPMLYTVEFNHRHLNRNVVGSTVSMQVL